VTDGGEVINRILTNTLSKRYDLLMFMQYCNMSQNFTNCNIHSKILGTFRIELI